MNTLYEAVRGSMSEPLEPQRIAFYGDEVLAVQQPDGVIAVVFARMCDNIGRPRVTETRRAHGHAVLSTGLVELSIHTHGGPQTMLCLRLDLVPLWLAGIPAKRIKADYREKLVRYQTEAAAVLWRAFKPQIVQTEEPADAASALAVQQLEHIIGQSKAMQRMAEEQIVLIQRMDAAARMVKGLRSDVTAVQVRLGVLEDRLHPTAYITEAQATEVSNQVKALAELLTSQDAKKNQYQSVFAELYRRFGVPSYKHIRQEQYADVLAFLDDWRTAAQRGTSDAALD